MVYFQKKKMKRTSKNIFTLPMMIVMIVVMCALLKCSSGSSVTQESINCYLSLPAFLTVRYAYPAPSPKDVDPITLNFVDFKLFMNGRVPNSLGFFGLPKIEDLQKIENDKYLSNLMIQAQKGLNGCAKDGKDIFSLESLKETAEKLNFLKTQKTTKKQFSKLEHLSFKIKSQNKAAYLKSKVLGMVREGRENLKKIHKKIKNLFSKKTSPKSPQDHFSIKIDEEEFILPKTGILLDPEYFKNDIFIEIGRLKKFGEKMNKRAKFSVSDLQELRRLTTDSLDQRQPLFDFGRNILFTYAYYNPEEVVGDSKFKIEVKE